MLEHSSAELGGAVCRVRGRLLLGRGITMTIIPLRVSDYRWYQLRDLHPATATRFPCYTSDVSNCDIDKLNCDVQSILGQLYNNTIQLTVGQGAVS